jgi:flagellar basal body rod protein FlgF
MTSSTTTSLPVTLIAKEDLTMTIGEHTGTLAKKGDRLTLIVQHDGFLEVMASDGTSFYTSNDKVVLAS